eukprot:9370419-Pyramimonas_sp.AAC.1
MSTEEPLPASNGFAAFRFANETRRRGRDRERRRLCFALQRREACLSGRKYGAILADERDGVICSLSSSAIGARY